MTPTEIAKEFKPVFDQAKELSNAYYRSKERTHNEPVIEEVDFIELTDSPSSTRRRFSSGKSMLQSVMTTLAPVIGHSQEDKRKNEKFPHKMPFVTVRMYVYWCIDTVYVCPFDIHVENQSLTPYIVHKTPV